MLKNIVVAVDGSQQAYRACEVSADLAAKYDAQLILIYVVRTVADDIPEGLRDLARTEHTELSAWKWMEDVANRILETAASCARSCAAERIESIVAQGEPAEAILEAIKSRQANLVVMGRSGLGTLTGLLMGSVSYKVARLADCPCLIVP